MEDEQIYAGCTRLRRQLADWLETLSPDQLDTPSLCSEWTVREVAGHLVAVLRLSPRELLVEVVRSGFRVDRANTQLARRTADQPVERLVGQLRELAGRRLKVPVVREYGPLIDLLVHGGDMRLPLGLPMAAEPDLTVEALGRVASGVPGVVPRTRLAGLRLVATDGDQWWRDGEVVEGSLNDLLMAACGRRAVLDRLSGPGAAILGGRL